MDQSRMAPTEENERFASAVMERQTSILESIASGAPPAEYLSAIADLVEAALHGASCAVSLSIEDASVRGEGGIFAASASLGDPDRGIRVVPVMTDGRVVGEVFVILRPERELTVDEDVILKQVAHLGAVGAHREQWAAKLSHQATHDSLTGLANRTLFLDRLGEALLREHRSGTSTAVMFVDLDRFKVVNDSLGHSAGDVLLQQVAQRLLCAIRPSDTLSRFGGDEFAVLCEGLTSTVEAIEIGQRLLSEISGIYRLAEQRIFVSASVGVAINGDSLDTPELLVRDADAAMYRAKQSGRGRVEVFERATRPALGLRLETENAFREAVTHQGITVVYQPLIRLADEKVVGVEALARWRDRPEIGPGNFVAMAEDMGLASALGRTILKQVSADMSRWRELTGNKEFFVSANLSPHHLADPEVIPMVKAMLRWGGIDPVSLCLEITEGTLIEDAAHGRHLENLSDLGIRLAIDDFGTGYSSFSYLKRLPVDFLKLDRSLIKEVGHNPQDAAIVSAVVGLARDLGISSIAEGVEEPAQKDVLRSIGCDIGQGFWWAQPLPAPRITQLLRNEATLHIIHPDAPRAPSV